MTREPDDQRRAIRWWKGAWPVCYQGAIPCFPLRAVVVHDGGYGHRGPAAGEGGAGGMVRSVVRRVVYRFSSLK